MLPFRPLGDTRKCAFLTPYPQQIELCGSEFDATGFCPDIHNEAGEADIAELFENRLAHFLNIKNSPKYDTKLPFHLHIDELGLRPESYRLSIRKEAIVVAGQDAAGLFYGLQTLLQLVAFCPHSLPELDITDWPNAKVRSVMLDLGRSVYPRPLIERCIRIMAQLKMNVLHLHLYDDQLCGIRFDNLPLGRENPGALSIDDLKAIILYARQFHISVWPEMESWGHCGSLIYHYPECYGGPGMWEGQSLGIGETTFQLLERIYESIIPVLEPNSTVHLGLDEATWKLLPDYENKGKDLTPEWLVEHLYERVDAIARSHRKNLDVCVWADHGGRPIPDRLHDKIIVEPWAYFDLQEREITEKVRKYSSKDQPRFLMGAGQSSVHFSGSFGATRHWCLQGYTTTNCLGVDLCLWEGNYLERYLLTLYGGADYAWNASNAYQPPALDKDPYREMAIAQVHSRMLSWQTLFEEANDTGILTDRGPAIYRGYYIDGALAGQPVAPTVNAVNHTHSAEMTE